MPVTVTVPTQWPHGVPARNGLPPRNSIARILDAETIFLSASRRYSIYVPLGRGYNDQLSDSEAPTGDREEIKLRVPSWTTYLRWGVLADDDAEDAVVQVQRIGSPGETYYHTIYCPSPGGDYLPSAAFFLSDGAPEGDDAPDHISADHDSDGWVTITVELWLSEAELYGVVFEALRLDTITA